MIRVLVPNRRLRVPSVQENATAGLPDVSHATNIAYRHLPLDLLDQEGGGSKQGLSQGSSPASSKSTTAHSARKVVSLNTNGRKAKKGHSPSPLGRHLKCGGSEANDDGDVLLVRDSVDRPSLSSADGVVATQPSSALTPSKEGGGAIKSFSLAEGKLIV